MSRRAEFAQGHQLKMFMSPDEIIDTANKMDSHLYGVFDNKAYGTPRQQWEHPNSGDGNMSLRDDKLWDIEHTHKGDDYKTKPFETMPPVQLLHYRSVGSRRPQLNDGHHRLAWAEKNKVPFIAVEHRIGEV